MMLPAPIEAREVKAHCDFLVLVSRYVRLHRAGRQFVALCPFHRERNASCFFDREKQVFHCFGCKAGGDLFDFVMRAEGCDFVQALRIVSRSSSEATSSRAAGALPARRNLRMESFFEAATRIVASLPMLGSLPACPRCSVSMSFRVYRNNRFGGAYRCSHCQVIFGPKELRQRLCAERGASCQWCGATAPVQMHHIVKNGSQYDPGSIVLLCAGCRANVRKLLAIHRYFERRSREAPNEVRGLPPHSWTAGAASPPLLEKPG